MGWVVASGGVFWCVLLGSDDLERSNGFFGGNFFGIFCFGLGVGRAVGAAMVSGGTRGALGFGALFLCIAGVVVFGGMDGVIFGCLGVTYFDWGGVMGSTGDRGGGEGDGSRKGEV